MHAIILISSLLTISSRRAVNTTIDSDVVTITQVVIELMLILNPSSSSPTYYITKDAFKSQYIID